MNCTKLLLFLLLLCPQLTRAQSDISSRIDWFDSFLSKRLDGDQNANIDSLKSELAKTIDVNDKASQARVMKELGMIQLQIPDYANAFTNFIRALEIEDSLSLPEEKVISYLAMAKVFEEVGEYQKSIEMMENATELSRPMDDVNVLAFILNNMGRVNTLLGQDSAAADNYELVLKNKLALKSRKPEADAYFNLGLLSIEKRNFGEALKNHKAGLEIRREMKDEAGEARSLYKIGEVYELLKNNEKAHANYAVALQIFTRLNNLSGLAETYNNIGVLYYKQGTFERAAANLALGLDAAKAIQSAEQSAKSYEYLSLCFKATGDFKKALTYRESHGEMIEFMRLEKIEQVLSERQNRSVIEKKEMKIRELQLVQIERELKIEAQRKTQNFLTILMGFGAVIILLVLYLYLIKRRSNIALEAAHAKVNQQNQELQNLNATKDKFFSIISHDLKGPLNSFTAFSKMLINHTDSLTKEEIQMLAKEIDKNLKNLFTLLENLLEWSRSQTGNIQFTPELFDVGELFRQNTELLGAQAKNKSLRLEYNVTGKCTVSAHKHSINTVIRNLISNAIKFTPEGGSILVNGSAENEMVRVSVQDSGVGMTPDVLAKLFRIDTKYTTHGTANEKGTGLGLILCKDFVEKNGGKIGVTSEPGKGSTFYFTLPIVSVPQAQPVLDEINA